MASRDHARSAEKATRDPIARAAPEREPVRTLAELQTLDDEEILEGYRDGLNEEPEPGDNRSKAYWHGWRNGRNDRAGISDAAGRALAREYLADQRRRAR